jgi:hypothetical protein
MIDVALPEQLPIPKDVLVVWVIYDHPKDFREGYVLRAQFADKGGITISSICWYADDPDKLRSILPPGVVFMPRQQGDDVAILETWI